MKRGALIGLSSVAGLAVVAGLVVKARKKPTAGSGYNLGTGEKTIPIVPPPPDAVWLKSTPEEYGPAPAAPGAPTGGAGGAGGEQGNVSGGAPSGGAPGFAVYLTGTTQLLELDAGKFLDSRFSVLPIDERPTESQLAAIFTAFTNLGVDSRGKVRTRPSYDATNAAMDLAATWDMQKVPAPVGRAVRDFARMAWEQLPAAVGSKTA